MNNETRNLGPEWERKPQFSLLPWDIIWGIAQVFSFGATKHSKGDWKTHDADYFIDKIYRHMGEVHAGVTSDEDTQMHPIFHVCATVIMLAWVLTIKGTGMTPEGRVPWSVWRESILKEKENLVHQDELGTICCTRCGSVLEREGGFRCEKCEGTEQ